MTPSPPRDDERAFLASYDADRFPHPSVAVDVVLLSLRSRELVVGLLARDEHPQRGKWALPGGFVRMDESLDAAAARVLADKAGLRCVFVEQLYTFGEPRRDPRTRVISVAYYALVSTARLSGIEAGALAFGRLRVPWPGEEGGPVTVLD
ncbi:MAG: NUDIX domain-containing protein, partial [Gammaproteobacteria bacterium]|nr:NUDIX domain-containing protein [Gammaproteobacteria bacterium]